MRAEEDAGLSRAVSRRQAFVLGILASLCIVAYLPVFRQPLLEDDWPNIDLARKWVELLSNPVFRYRTMHWLLTYAVDQASGLAAPAFYAASLAMHIIATWLVYALGSLPRIGWRVSLAAAAFFAVYEGHQEAIMWFSASAETLMFIFGLGAVLLWARGRYIAAFVLFLLALATKESAVIFAPLMLLIERRWKQWIPFGSASAAYVALVFSARSHSFRFQDGSFSLSAPFWITWPVSCWRMLWIWGVLALIVLLFHRKLPRPAALGLQWMAAALVPYIFLTYMHRVPSRQTYIASAGLALLIGAAFVLLRPRLMPVVAAVVIVVNVGYLWTRKRSQFLERAAPTEALIEVVRKSPGPVYVRCFPLAAITAEAAARLGAGKQVVWKPEPGATEWCWQRPR